MADRVRLTTTLDRDVIARRSRELAASEVADRLRDRRPVGECREEC
jgi:hypothetical protein